MRSDALGRVASASSSSSSSATKTVVVTSCTKENGTIDDDDVDDDANSINHMYDTDKISNKSIVTIASKDLIDNTSTSNNKGFHYYSSNETNSNNNTYKITNPNPNPNTDTNSNTIITRKCTSGRGSVVGWTTCPLCTQQQEKVQEEFLNTINRSRTVLANQKKISNNTSSDTCSDMINQEHVNLNQVQEQQFNVSVDKQQPKQKQQQQQKQQKQQKQKRRYVLGRGIASHLHAVHTPWLVLVQARNKKHNKKNNTKNKKNKKSYDTRTDISNDTSIIINVDNINGHKQQQHQQHQQLCEQSERTVNSNNVYDNNNDPFIGNNNDNNTNRKRKRTKLDNESDNDKCIFINNNNQSTVHQTITNIQQQTQHHQQHNDKQRILSWEPTQQEQNEWDEQVLNIIFELDILAQKSFDHSNIITSDNNNNNNNNNNNSNTNNNLFTYKTQYGTVEITRTCPGHVKSNPTSVSLSLLQQQQQQQRTQTTNVPYRQSLPPFLQAAADGNLLLLQQMINDVITSTSINTTIPPPPPALTDFSTSSINNNNNNNTGTSTKEESQNVVNAIQKLLSTTDRHLSTAEHWAAGGGHLQCLQYLFQLHTMYNVQLPNDHSNWKNEEEEQLQPQRQRRIRRRDGKSCLHYAARNGHINCIEYLLSLSHNTITYANNKNIDDTIIIRDEKSSCTTTTNVNRIFSVHDKSGDGTTPLHLACYGCHYYTVKYLLEIAHANVHETNDWGCSVAHFVAISKNHSILCTNNQNSGDTTSTSIDDNNGTSTNCNHTNENDTVLVSTSSTLTSIWKICDYLYQKPYNVSFVIRQKQGHSPLHKAAQYLNRPFLEWMMKQNLLLINKLNQQQSSLSMIDNNSSNTNNNTSNSNSTSSTILVQQELLEQYKQAGQPDDGGHTPSSIWIACGGDTDFGSRMKHEFGW